MPPPARPSKSGGKRKSAASADPHDPLAALAPGAAPATDRAMDHDAGEDDEAPRGGGGKTLGERLRSIERSAVDDAGPSSSSDDDDEPASSSRKGKTKKGTKDAAAAKDASRSSRKESAREAAIAEALGTSSPAAPPKADSLAVLLAQALLAEDRALIERCLSVADPDVVRNTVARLQPHSAIQLLRAALDRMRSKPSRGEQLARWMRTVLLHHAGHCATSASARRAVAELRSVADAHAAMQPSLLSLLGRLDLLLHARRSRGRRGRGEGGRPGDGGGFPGGDGGGEDVPGDAAFVSTYDEAEDDAELVEDADDDDAEEASEWETDDGSDDGSDDDGDGGSSDDASSDESGDDESDDEE